MIDYLFRTKELIDWLGQRLFIFHVSFDVPGQLTLSFFWTGLVLGREAVSLIKILSTRLEDGLFDYI